MIRLHKVEPPEAISVKLIQKRLEFDSLTQAGEPVPDSVASYYRAPAIKALLMSETFEKCAYCESKFKHIDFGDVEHIVPKTLGSEERFAYKNLTMSCGVCNTFKSDSVDVLNPYSDEPSDHLSAHGPMVIRRPHSDIGLTTEKRLRLNRPALVERRLERLQSVATLLDQISRTSNSSIREVLVTQLMEEVGPNAEYSFAVGEYVKATYKTGSTTA